MTDDARSWAGDRAIRAVRPCVLVVDEDRAARIGLVQLLFDNGIEAMGVASPEAALQHMCSRSFHLVVAEQCITGAIGGTQLLEVARPRSPNTAGVLLTVDLPPDV